MNSPICLFTYNRLAETRQTVKALKANHLASTSELFIFSDGPKEDVDKIKVKRVRKYLRTINGFNSIHIFESSVNKGLANSIISGVSKIIDEYGKVIVLEDDLITTPNFLDFMNQALFYYEDEKMIQSVNGFSLYIKEKVVDVYFQMRPFSWGWGTWEHYWDKNIFDKESIKSEIYTKQSILSEFRKKCGDDISDMLVGSIENNNESWYVRWAFNHFMNDNYSVYPTYSLVENIGFGKHGTHCKGINSYNYKMNKNDRRHFDLRRFNKPSNKTRNKFLRYFTKSHKIYFRLKLLMSSSGRKQLINDFMTRLK